MTEGAPFGANAVLAEGAERIRAKDAENFSADRIKEFCENPRCIQSGKSAGGSSAPSVQITKASAFSASFCDLCGNPYQRLCG